MRQAIALPLGVLLLWTSTQCAEPAATVVGEFSNMRYTDEHAYGYTVQLWREREQLFGLLLVSAGLAGDTPAGLIENVKFDSRTGRLSFSAKLTTGSVMLAGGGQQPSRDFFEFEGTLARTTLAGTLKQSDGIQPARTPVSKKVPSEKVTLTRQRETTMSPKQNYGEWEREIREILRFRGPKW